MCSRYDRQHHRKDRQAIPALRCDCSLVERDDLLGDGEAQPGPAGAASCIQPVKLLENPLQLLPGDSPAAVGKSQLYGLFGRMCGWQIC